MRGRAADALSRVAPWVMGVGFTLATLGFAWGVSRLVFLGDPGVSIEPPIWFRVVIGGLTLAAAGVLSMLVSLILDDKR